MSTAIATRSDNGVLSIEERNRLIGELILKNASPQQQKLAIEICDRYGLDPLLRHVTFISNSLYITRDGLMHFAHKSGQFDGMETEATRDQDGQWTATCRVWRKDMSRPFVVSVYQTEHENKQSSAWRQSPRAMTVKCAVVACMRLAFDISLSGAEEVGYDGKSSWLEHAEIIDVTPAPSGAAPSALSRAPAASATAAPQQAPAAPPKRKIKNVTPEETISVIRDETQPLDRRQNAVGYLFSQARDTETLNAYFATVMQYADSVEGLAHGGAALGDAATEAFHACEDELTDIDVMVPTGQATPVAAEA